LECVSAVAGVANGERLRNAGGRDLEAGGEELSVLQWLLDAAEVVDNLAVEQRDGYAALEGEIEGVMDGDLFCGVRQGRMLECGEKPAF
jgi:hypothetical protein